MLSYRHAFHAGNYADVLKHLVLLKSLEHMLQKPGPLLYIDTHAGAGRYPLNSSMAQRTHEHATGAGALQFEELSSHFEHYGKLLESYAHKGLSPGSPLIAAEILRPVDKLKLFELHPSDQPSLSKLFQNDRRVSVSKSDGHHALKSLLPAPQKRALILMDPSYEIKTEYQQVVESLSEGYKRMPTATYLLWYPVVQRQNIDRMLKQFKSSKMRNVWQFEFGLQADNDEHGMTASGIIAVNPAWTLPSLLVDALPGLKEQLAPDQGHFAINNIVPE